jgi:hypothetical protein
MAVPIVLDRFYRRRTINADDLDGRPGDCHACRPAVPRDFADILEPLNVEARYPTDREKVMRSMNSERSRSIID